MILSQKTAAVAGTGFIGPVHVEGLRRLGIRVKGILGSSPAKSEMAAKTLGLPKAYVSYEEILSDPEIEVVHIATPNRQHRDMVIGALGAGKHVVCEKPLGTTSAETYELVEQAHQNPTLVTAVNYNVRFYPLALHARDLLQAGAIGRVLSVRGAYIQDWLLKDTDWNWRLLVQEGGELRAVGDIGTHWMDLILFITGLRIDSVFADLATLIPVRQRPKVAGSTFQGSDNKAGAAASEPVRIETEDWGAVLFRFANGARGSMCVSQVTAGRKNQITFEISGSEGSLAWDSEHPNDLWLGHRDKPNELLIRDPSLLSAGIRSFASYPGGHNEGFPDTFKQLYRAIYEYLEERDFSRPKIFAGFEDGHEELLLCEAILQSHRAQAWVAVKRNQTEYS
ncbi:MAG: Gfo/Idh/MocA family oxidoreductase [Verrucomicrobia bacterium]|nr:Gfo/Idh/MocA family oxidoreductase [Verrucomicrobiota bacterium]